MRLIKGLFGAVLFLAGCAGVLAGLGLAATGALAIKDQCPLGHDCHDARMVLGLGAAFFIAGCCAVFAAERLSRDRPADERRNLR